MNFRVCAAGYRLKKTNKRKFRISLEWIDILKIQKVLNSEHHKEQAKEVLRKSANFSFAGVKGLSAV